MINILEIRISILLILVFHPFMINFVVSECPKKPFNCGILGNLQFPFSNYSKPECGLFSVNCDISPPKVQFGPGGIWYDVHDMLSTDKFRVLDTRLHFDLIDKSCSFLENRFSVPKSAFLSFTISPTLTMFSCSKSLDPDVQVNFTSYRNYTGCNFSLYYKNQADDFLSGNTSNIPENCSAVQMPVKLDNQDSDDLFQMLTADFNIEWNVSADLDCLSCQLRGGNCVGDDNGLLCKENSKTNKALLIGGVAVTVLTPSFIFLFFYRWKLTLLKLLGLQKEMPDNEKNIEFFLKNNGNLALIRYKYSDLKKMSRSFNENLGKGGYGSVYKGKLRDALLEKLDIETLFRRHL